MNAADESWEILQQFLPGNLEESAREHGAFRRARGEIQSAEVLLRLLLLHVAGGLSLEQTVVRAREHKLVNISAVGLFKRLRSSGPCQAAAQFGALVGLADRTIGEEALGGLE